MIYIPLYLVCAALMTWFSIKASVYVDLLDKKTNLSGAFIGGVKATAGGIAAAVFFGYIASLISKPKIKKQ